MKSIRERLSEKAAQNRIPMISAFELLPVCNLSCKMCYVRKSMAEVNQAGGLKNGKWWLDVARKARDAGLLYPLLTGGEPFLHPDFREILAGMDALGLQFSINTNGTMINREWAAFLAKHRPVRVNLTLYGASEASYRNLCGNGDAYHRVREAVALLKEYQIPLKFNASITPENVGELDAIVAYAKSQECPLQVATYMFPPIRRDETSFGKNQRLSPEEAGLARVRADYLQNDPDWFLGQAARFARFVPLHRIAEFRGPQEEMRMGCRAGVCSFWVDWQGNLSNCGMFPSVKLEPDDDFRTKWRELVEQTAAVRYQPGCAGCPNCWLCHPCIAMVSNECGDIDGTPEYLCRMNQASAKYYREFAEKYYPGRLPGAQPRAEQQDICEI